MIEIHYHLLHGLDDGPKSIEDSLALAEASIAEGTTHIVCTPHANSTYEYDPELRRSKIETLQERLGNRVTLGFGCDFHLSYDNIEDLYRDPSKYSINGKQYLLVEFPDFGIAPNMSDVLFRMLTMGIVPIITHPERNQTLQVTPARLDEWVKIGCPIQITAGSLQGRFGKTAEAMSHRLLSRDMVHFLASDAHSMSSRPPSLARAHEIVKEHYDAEMADRLCIHNPRAVFFGEELPPQPAPRAEEDGRSKKRGLFGFLGKR